ncbi:hypothetical protein FKM82_016213 [Ascaphus truei]
MAFCPEELAILIFESRQGILNWCHVDDRVTSPHHSANLHVKKNTVSVRLLNHSADISAHSYDSTTKPRKYHQTRDGRARMSRDLCVVFWRVISLFRH